MIWARIAIGCFYERTTHQGWFRRIAIVGAVVCGIPAGLIFAMATYFLLSEKPGDAGEAAMLGGAWVIGAGVLYIAARALGWIVAGFAGDGEKISN